MTEPSPGPVPSLAATASESTEESLRRERDAVGDHPDTGGLVTPDHAQSAPAGEDQQ